MSRRRGVGGLGASPVLIGAVTTLVVIVAVFLAYNANSGLPFVPTYDLKAELPNAANLVVGNDVRVGGSRVGVVSEIEPRTADDGTAIAVINMKLENRVDPLPEDSTLIVRPRSSLGLKYVEITPGESAEGFDAGATVPATNARPEPVEIDEVFNTFDEETRDGSRKSLKGFGDGLVGRGDDLNLTIEELKPLLRNLQPVAENLSDPDTHLARFFKELNDAAEIVAPVAEEQAALFVNLDTTFAALSDVARPFIQDTITRSVPAMDVAIREFPQQRPFLRNATALARELRPGAAVLPDTLPDLADAAEIGTRTLRKTPPFNEDLEDVFLSLKEFAEDPLVPRGVHRLTETVEVLEPTLAFLAPVQTKCNLIANWFGNIGSVLSEGDSNGTWQRFIIISAPQGPNSEGGPSSAPAAGPSADNYLHSNPYPNHMAEGQVQECEAGNEDFLQGRKVIGNVPGNQGTAAPGIVDEPGSGEE